MLGHSEAHQVLFCIVSTLTSIFDFSTGIQYPENEFFSYYDYSIIVRFLAILVNDNRPQMTHPSRTYQDLTTENALLKKKIQELELLGAEHKQLEEALIDSETRLRTIVEGTPALVVSVDLNGHFTYANDATVKSLGYANPEELIGMSYLHFIHPEDRRRVLETFIKQIDTRQTSLMQEFRVTDTEGKVKWYSFLSTLAIKNGQLVGQSGVAQDITDRKEAEKSLQESQRKYQLLAENVDDIIWTMNAELTHYTYISPSIANLGYTPEEFMAQPFDAFIAPKYREHIRKSISNRLQKELKGEGDNVLGRWELEFRKKDGENLFVESLTRLLRDENGAFQGLLGVTRDITERKRTEQILLESEERYQSILNASPDNITITDVNGQILMISPAGLMMFGYESEGEVLGNLVTAHVVPEDRDRALSNLNLKAQGVLSGPDEYRGLRKDSSTFDIEVMSNFMRDHAGRPTRVVIVIRDITERKQIEEERKKMQFQLQQAQKMEAIGTLAGGIAHDFNNILGAILGYAEMARDDCPKDAIAASYLNEVILASNRAKDLVKQILAFSRQTKAQKVPLQPADIVKEAIILLRSSIPTTIDFQQDIDPETDLILADATQFHQIIINLCTNGYHAMEETGGTLSVSLKNTLLTPQDLVTVPPLQPGHYVQLSIKDTGTGIAPEMLARIFDPYFTTKETGKGTGMGLAIAHGIAKSSGGFITCRSEMGVETVFEVFLPALSEKTVPETQEVNFTPFGTERILLVDDEETLTRMGQTMLEKLGYVVTARSGSLQALATFNEQPDTFDLVITDQTMPEMTGFDLARRILQIRPNMPIILCTGYSGQVSEEKARAFGIKGFAMKPLAIKDIATMIRKILNEEKSISYL